MIGFGGGGGGGVDDVVSLRRFVVVASLCRFFAFDFEAEKY